MSDESKTVDFHNHQIRIAEETLDLEKKKLEFEKGRAKIESRFFNRNLGIIITSIISLTAIVFSVYQFLVNQSRMEDELELKAISIITDQISSNLDEQSFNKQLQYVKKVIKAALPEHVANKIVSRIDKSDLFLSELEAWSADRQAANKKSIVLLLDTNYSDNVYSPTQKSLGGTNADDIFEVLSGMPIQLIRDTIKAKWDNEILIWRLKPKLIILHRDCFAYDKSVDSDTAEEKFINFIKELNEFFPKPPKLIIYSRLPFKSIEDLIAKISDQIKDDKKTMKTTMRPFSLEYPTHFRALINADRLRKEVIKILEITDSPVYLSPFQMRPSHE